jgi:hypothetical protein
VVLNCLVHQQDGNAIANRISLRAARALQRGSVVAHSQGLTAGGAHQNFKKIGRDHPEDCTSSLFPLLTVEW